MGVVVDLAERRRRVDAQSAAQRERARAVHPSAPRYWVPSTGLDAHVIVGTVTLCGFPVGIPVTAPPGARLCASCHS